MLTLLGLQTVSAQETPTAISKGKWMVETNLSPLTGLSTSGFSFYSNNGAQLWSVGGEAGYFFQDKLAVKAGLGFTGQRYVFDFDGQKIELNSTHSFIYKAGLKYYIINQFPVQVDLGGINSGGEKLSLLMDAFENSIPSYFGKPIAICVPAHPGK